MSIFGKILAILNVFAAIGAVALIAMDYAKRRSWEYQVFRQDLMINGLPLDKEERDGQGNPLYEDIGPQTQKELFPQGNAVTTQTEEVERVKSQLGSKIGSASDKKRKIYFLARVLTPLAVTSEQRQGMLAYQTYLRDDKTFEELKKLFTQADQAARLPQPKAKKERTYEESFKEALAAQHANPPGPLAEALLTVLKTDPRTPLDKALDQSLDNQLAQLQGQLDQLFKDALDRTQMLDGKAQERPVSQRKRNVAHLLFNLVDALSDESAGASSKFDLVENPAYKRFLTVVGVPAAVTAVNDEAKVLSEITAQVDLERRRERGTFALEHRKMIEMILTKVGELEMHSLQLARKQKELAGHEEDLKKRGLDVKFYQDQLEAARRETSANLKDLRTMSDALFKQKVELRDASKVNQVLEKQIRVLEEGR